LGFFKVQFSLLRVSTPGEEPDAKKAMKAKEGKKEKWLEELQVT